MATTRRLNDDGSVYVTTFYGGKKRGRCYQFTVNFKGERVSHILNDEEFFKLLCRPEAHLIGFDDGIRPEFDN